MFYDVISRASKIKAIEGTLHNENVVVLKREENNFLLKISEGNMNFKRGRFFACRSLNKESYFTTPQYRSFVKLLSHM